MRTAAKPCFSIVCRKKAIRIDMNPVLEYKEGGYRKIPATAFDIKRIVLFAKDVHEFLLHRRISTPTQHKVLISATVTTKRQITRSQSNVPAGGGEINQEERQGHTGSRLSG